MSKAVQGREDESAVKRKTWVGMMKICKMAAVSMICIGILRFSIIFFLEGDSVLDVTTVGSIALGVVAYIITIIAPTAEQIEQMNEKAKAKRAAKPKKD